MKNFCTNCGTKLKENAKFCHNCGVATSSEYEENMDEFENDNLYKEPTDEDRRSGIELITKYLEKKMGK